MTKMKVLFIAFISLGLCFGMFARQVEAQDEFKPVLIFCTPDGNTALKAFRDISTLAGFPDAADTVESTLNSIEELDKTKPKGIVILSDGEQFQGYAFGPISDFRAFPFVDMLDIEDEGDGNFTLALAQGYNIHIKQESEWVFLSLFPLPENLPSDPSIYFEGLDEQYLSALKINVSDLPQETCLNYLDLARAMVGAVAQTEADEMNFQFLIDQYEQILLEADTYLTGWKLAPGTNDLIFEAETTFLPDTKFAEMLKQWSQLKSHFSGFFHEDGSLLSFIGCSLIPDSQKEWVSTLYGSYIQDFRESVNEGSVGELNESELAMVNGLIDNFESVLLGTFEAGQFDFGFSLLDTGTLLGGMSLAEGEKVADSIASLVEIVPEQYQKYIKLDGAEYQGYKLSSFVLPLNESGCPELPESLEDDTLTVIVAIKDDALCLAAGIEKDAAAVLKKAIDDSIANPIVPETGVVMAPYAIADIAKRYGILEIPDTPEEMIEIMDIIGRCPKDAQYTGSTTYGNNSVKVTGVASAKMLPMIGEIIKFAMKNFAQNDSLDLDSLDFDDDLEE